MLISLKTRHHRKHQQQQCLPNRKEARIMCDSVNAAISKITLEVVQTLDMGTQRAQCGFNANLANLKTISSEHTAFMQE